jgi:hypothetical protein
VNIIAVDWGKDARKRSAYRAELATRRISHLPFDGSVLHLVEYASSLEPPVLIGIDAAIGFPNASWQRLRKTGACQSGNFIDFLLSTILPAGFFDPVTKPADWSPKRPFIHPPPGSWSLKAFVEASNGGFYRQIDLRLNGNPIFVTSGIPGSVGSGTQALWQELIAIGKTSKFLVWPFHGSLGILLNAETPVIAEMYPKACYGIAMAKTLPAPLMSLAKTRQGSRQDALARLQDSDWVASSQIVLQDLDAALSNEDDFDALMSAAALLRMVVENSPLEGPEDASSTVEGSVLGAASLTNSAIRINSPQPKQSAWVKTKSTRLPQAYPCPIPGCHHVFHNTRGGWDAHVASVARHPEWHPDVLDATERKQLFKREFPGWFHK